MFCRKHQTSSSLLLLTRIFLSVSVSSSDLGQLFSTHVKEKYPTLAPMPSERCIGWTYWDNLNFLCIPCETKYPILKGSQFTENCGWSDDQFQESLVYEECRKGTFNDGSQTSCRPCRSCQTPEFIACNTTSDTICCSQWEKILDGKCVSQPLHTTEITTPSTTPIVSTTESTTERTTERTTESPTESRTVSKTVSRTPPLMPSVASSTPHSTNNPDMLLTNLTGIYVFLGILSALSLLCLFLVIKRMRNKQCNEEFGMKNSIGGSFSKKSIDRFQQSVSYNIIKENGNNDHMMESFHVIDPEVQKAPLKTVLNNLDVLEELVLVLDPEISGCKNTRHLASQCSFSFAWINYAYSMKDKKSPLVAVLEGVVTKNPDWTVGHFAKLLSAIGRNDAVEILTKLPAGAEE